MTVDDAVAAIGRFRNGALATLEATRFATGRKNALTIEINGRAGSLFFDLEEMNRLRFYSARDPEGRRGFRDILVTETSHPYLNHWWPSGHLIGYEHTFIHTIADFVKAIVRRETVAPSFVDGLTNQRVPAGIAESARTGQCVALAFGGHRPPLQGKSRS